MSLGLLGAYDSSSSSDSDSDSNETNEEKLPPADQLLTNPFAQSAALPKPSFLVEAKDFTKEKAISTESDSSVFSNPFRAREEKKKAVLERHVAMTTKQEDQKTIEGKKVCWNFRKGRCRFGHKCTFAHGKKQ